MHYLFIYFLQFFNEFFNTKTMKKKKRKREKKESFWKIFMLLPFHRGLGTINRRLHKILWKKAKFSKTLFVNFYLCFKTSPDSYICEITINVSHKVICSMFMPFNTYIKRQFNIMYIYIAQKQLKDI